MKNFIILTLLFTTLGCFAQTKSNLPIKMYDRNYYLDSKKLSIKDVELYLQDKNSAAHDLVYTGRQYIKTGNILVAIGSVSLIYSFIAEKQSAKNVLYGITFATCGATIIYSLNGGKKVNEGIRLYNDSLR